MNKIRLLFFATLRDRAGMRTGEIEVPEGSTVRELKDAIGAQYPALRAAVDHVLVAINREYARDETTVPDGAEVALFPPVSGG